MQIKYFTTDVETIAFKPTVNISGNMQNQPEPVFCVL